LGLRLKSLKALKALKALKSLKSFLDERARKRALS
jgi:hypothetical protein